MGPLLNEFLVDSAKDPLDEKPLVMVFELWLWPVDCDEVKANLPFEVG